MSDFTDQLNRSITLFDKPLRIISLVPSQTELLYDLGLDEEVVGITKFCVHPDVWYRTKTRVGGTKTINIDKVKSLSPTLIIANKEENTKSDIEALEKIAQVWISDVRDLESAYDMIDKIGCLVSKKEKAKQLTTEIKTGFKQIQGLFPNKKVLYVIWNEPLMIAGKDTFIDAIMMHLGLENAAAQKERYPELTITESQTLEPDYIFLSSEPFPFKEKHLGYFKSSFPKSQVALVDGELFSWYGSRLSHYAPYFLELKKQLED
jgi:ABC-type Fe3+-hydroxamate transport system substrate-binding protein